MPRRSQPNSASEELRHKLVDLLTNFADALQTDELRNKVRALVPSFHLLRDLGSSLLLMPTRSAARDRIREYLLKYPFQVIDGDELMVISGIGEWARRLRELRVQFGWWIYSGDTFADEIKAARDDGDMSEIVAWTEILGVDPNLIRPDQYVLMRTEQDREAALRWNVLNEIRKKDIAVKDKLLEYFRLNVQKEIPGDELIYLANSAKEWARRVRELRTEGGWPIVTKASGRPDLDVGVYVLEEDRQAEEHDRHIKDDVRVQVLQRDQYSCTWEGCGWSRSMLSRDDPRRFLELHHITQHKDKGANTVENLRTLCNVHHDQLHREARQTGLV